MRVFRISTGVCLLLLAGCAGQNAVVQSGAKISPVEKETVQDVLANGGFGPKLVKIPAGQFIMGSPENEPGRYNNEGPQHLVTFKKPFYLGLTEVSVGQFRRFVEATGYLTDGERNNGSYMRDNTIKNAPWRFRENVNWRMDHEGKVSIDDNPVVHVSWNDAQAYLAWLSKETGQKYRLPSEAELEYGNRAGSDGMFWWGEGSPQDNLTNVRGDKDRAFANPVTWERTPGEVSHAFAEGNTAELFKDFGDGFHGLAPVGNFSPNPFGLHDTTGNVWEWAEDCWHDNYVDAPTDGSAWIKGSDCVQRVIRGGSYYCYPRHVRSANRWVHWPEMRTMHIGFRVARDL